MEWSDHGIVLSSRPHGETGLVASLLTRAHGRHAGFVHGGVSRKARPIWQPGNVVEVAWRARLAEQLGNYTGEAARAACARASWTMPSELAGLAAACAMVDAALPEREPHPAMFEGFHAFLGVLGHPGWPAIYVRLELGLLQELGFGLDLEKCALTGDDARIWPSSRPRPAARCRARRPSPTVTSCWRCRPFYPPAGCRPMHEELRQGLDLTGYFLERHVFWPHNKPLPAARARFMETLQRQEQQ